MVTGDATSSERCFIVEYPSWTEQTEIAECYDLDPMCMVIQNIDLVSDHVFMQFDHVSKYASVGSKLYVILCF